MIDTHCHLDDKRFDGDRSAVMQRAQAAGVRHIVIPAVSPKNFVAVKQAAEAYPGGAYALGIHPLAIPEVSPVDLEHLQEAVALAMGDPRFVAIGEIGLDYYLSHLKTDEMAQKQEFFYQAQLKLARRYDLPVLVHIRRAQDRVLKYLRQVPDVRGVAHAFNGSEQQARGFIERGFYLGGGGAMTFTGSKRIRRLVSMLPIEHWVLETDAPDISPAWLHSHAPGEPPKRNEPAQVAGIAQVMAQLKEVSVEHIQAHTRMNAFALLPRLHALAHP